MSRFVNRREWNGQMLDDDDVAALSEAAGILSAYRFEVLAQGATLEQTSSVSLGYDHAGAMTSACIATNTGIEEYVLSYNSNETLSDVFWKIGSCGGTPTPTPIARMEYNYKNQRTSIESLGIKRYFVYDLMGNLIGEYNDQRQSISEYAYAGLWRLFRMDGLPGGSAGIGGCGGGCSAGNSADLISHYLSASLLLIPGFFVIFLGYNKKPLQMIVLCLILIGGFGIVMVASQKAYAQSGLDEVDYYYHNDYLMTPMFMTDKNGTVVWTMTQTPFDTLEINEDPDGDGNFVTNPFRFPGQYADSETNEMLWYNWNRYYIPSLGRYNSFDFAARHPQPYNYAYSNPSRYFDFYGLDSTDLSGYTKQELAILVDCDDPTTFDQNYSYCATTTARLDPEDFQPGKTEELFCNCCFRIFDAYVLNQPENPGLYGTESGPNLNWDYPENPYYFILKDNPAFRKIHASFTYANDCDKECSETCRGLVTEFNNSKWGWHDPFAWLSYLWRKSIKQ